MSEHKKPSRSHLAITISVLAVMAIGLLGYGLAPMFHGVWFGLLYRHPVGWALILLVGFSTFVTYKKCVKVTRSRYFGRPDTISGVHWLIIVAVTGIVLIIAYGIYATMLTQYKLVYSVDAEVIQNLPDTTATRYLPFEVAQTYGQNKMQDPQFELGDFDPIQLSSGEMAWVAPMVPSSFTGAFRKQQDGFVIIHQDGSVEQIRQPMKYGEGMQLRDSIYWQLDRKHYFVEKSEVYYLQINNKIVAVAPYIKYRFEFPVQVPTWGGVFLVHADGQIEDLSPKEAQADSRLTGQHIYPLELAKKISNAWKYRGGIWNKMFTHHDQTEVVTMEESSNQFPYLLPTEQGEQWFTAFKPRGNKSQGIYKMLYIDAHTGQTKIYELGLDSTLAGPGRAHDYIVGGINRQWERAESKSGNDIAIEPRPIMRNGEFYWLLSVTTRRYAGVTFSVAVNAKNPTDLRILNSPTQVQSFLDGTFEGERVDGSTIDSTDTPLLIGTPSADLSSKSDSELLQQLNDIVNELKRREQEGK